MNKENWVKMFKEIGLSEEQMKKWHHIFEKDYPEDHESFLQWLGIEKSEISKIRNMFK